jgi:cardiolipin synthase
MVERARSAILQRIPNLLSAARLIAAPLLCLLIWRHEYMWALAVIAVAGITDGLDGYLARALEAQSHLGEVLDPIADKVLMGGAFLTLALAGMVPLWLALLVVGRDAAILLYAGIALLAGKTVRRFPPTIWGKLSTSFQIAFTLALLGWLATWLPHWPVEVLTWMVAAMTAWSGLDYARRV